MIRFRNPGTQFSTQVQVLKELYKNLKDYENFNLDGMAKVIADGKLLTSNGFAGDEALKLGNNEDKSRNSPLMNAKMYAEVFRILGWATSYGKKSYPLVFTYNGAHIANSEGDAKKLFEQCVLGINNPNEIMDVKYDEQVRFFKSVLLCFKELGGVMYKHELCLGPMNVNDANEKEFQQMIQNLKSLRGDYNRLTKAFKDLSDSLNMAPTSVDNCTRLPIALLKACGFVEDYKTREIYKPKKLDCLKLTQRGEEVLNEIKDMKDLRIDEFNSYPDEIRKALVRIGIYKMLERADYDISPVKEQIERDEVLCKDILHGKELLFSPYQTIRREFIDNAMGFDKKTNNKEKSNIDILDEYQSDTSNKKTSEVIKKLDININANLDYELLTGEDDIEFLKHVNESQKMGKSVNDIVEELFNYYVTATQTTFYPLIATLFKVMGFKCTFSRPGDNGSRWDAIIEDKYRSIPIEIKSPTEELHISVKAIRQALENKIVLLSRKTYITQPEVTSLAVGYYIPNDRAEVSRLIRDFKKTYSVSIGVLDLKSLLQISISIIVDGKGFDKEKLYELEGIGNANIKRKK